MCSLGENLFGVGARVSETPVSGKETSFQLRVSYCIRKGGLEAWVGSGHRGTHGGGRVTLEGQPAALGTTPTVSPGVAQTPDSAFCLVIVLFHY